jgi:hypothetical protein
MRNILSNFILLALINTAAQTKAFTQSSESLAYSGNNTTSDKTALLAIGAWVMYSIESDKPCDTNSDGILTKNIASELPACAMDDIMYIKPNGKVVFERNKRCDPSEGAIESYNWELRSDNMFVISKGSVVAEMLFKYVTKQELALVIPSEAHGVMYYFTVRYKHP